MEASPHAPTMLSRSYQKFVKVVDSVYGCFRCGAGRLRNARVQKLLRVSDLFVYSVKEPLLEAIDHGHAGPELTQPSESIGENEHWFDNKCEPITIFPQWGGGIISNQGNVCHNYTFPA